MADIIEVTEIYKDDNGAEKLTKRWISKYYISEIVPDPSHTHTLINYHDKQIIKVSESVADLLAKMKA